MAIQAEKKWKGKRNSELTIALKIWLKCWRPGRMSNKRGVGLNKSSNLLWVSSFFCAFNICTPPSAVIHSGLTENHMARNGENVKSSRAANGRWKTGWRPSLIAKKSRVRLHIVGGVRATGETYELKAWKGWTRRLTMGKLWWTQDGDRALYGGHSS